jgi:hypothetical protein
MRCNSLSLGRDVRVGAGVDLDDDADEVDGRERVDGGLDGREVAERRVLVHDERVRGGLEGQRGLERAVLEAAHVPHPLQELPLDLFPRRRGAAQTQAARVRGYDARRREERHNGNAGQEPDARRGHCNAHSYSYYRPAGRPRRWRGVAGLVRRREGEKGEGAYLRRICFSNGRRLLFSKSTLFFQVISASIKSELSNSLRLDPFYI